MNQDHCRSRPIGTRSLTSAALVCCLSSAWLPAHAQINRCSDGSGNVIYTDSLCPSHLNSVQIEAAKTPEQIAIEQERAAQARAAQAQQRLDRLQEQRIQAETAALEASARASAAAEAAARAQTTNYANTAACLEATRQLTLSQSANGRYTAEERQRLERAQDTADRACLSPQDYAALQREKSSRPNTTIVINPPYWGPPNPGGPWGPITPGLPPVVLPPPQPPVVQPPIMAPPAPLPPVLTPQKPPAQSGIWRQPSQPESDPR